MRPVGVRYKHRGDILGWMRDDPRVETVKFLRDRWLGGVQAKPRGAFREGRDIGERLAQFRNCRIEGVAGAFARGANFHRAFPERALDP